MQFGSSSGIERLADQGCRPVSCIALKEQRAKQRSATLDPPFVVGQRQKTSSSNWANSGARTGWLAVLGIFAIEPRSACLAVRTPLEKLVAAAPFAAPL